MQVVSLARQRLSSGVIPLNTVKGTVIIGTKYWQSANTLYNNTYGIIKIRMEKYLMKSFQLAIRNIFFLIVLVILAATTIWLVRNQQGTPLTATTSTISAREEVVSASTRTPTPDAPPTLPTHIPEPTATPVIILGTHGEPPPPPPTPTPTPVNPKETMIVAFDTYVGRWDISPDDETLVVVGSAFNVEGERSSQLWLIGLTSKKVTQLPAYGGTPVWSPDGRRILFRSRQNDEYKINVIDKDGTNQKTLIALGREELLDYYWENSTEVNIVKPNGVQRLDLTGNTVNQMNLVIPTKTSTGTKPQVVAYPNGMIMVNDGHNLLNIQQNDEIKTIADSTGRSIDKFVLSFDGEKLAYVINEGRNDELWINEVDGDTSQMLYRIDGGHIYDLIWTPDGRVVVFGWRETGTSLNADLDLLRVDIHSGKVTPFQVDGVDIGFELNHRGNKLIYKRTNFSDPMDDGKTTFYQLEIE
jgi:hypothetical protein